MLGRLNGGFIPRRYRRSVVLGMSGVLVFGVLALGSPAAHGTPHHTSAAAKVPSGSKYEFTAVMAVPHSSDLWTLGSYGSDANFHYRIGRRHGGHFKRIHLPSYGGRYGLLRTFASASPKAVWIGGARQLPHGIQDLPAIWRWSGKKWVGAKLPAMQNGITGVTSMSASSPTNAWAVGSLYAVQPGVEYALHWNGKKWVGVPTPGGVGLTAISTLGATKTWATSGNAIDYWNGTAWSTSETAAANVNFADIAMSSPRLGYAVGSATGSTLGKGSPVMMRFNGKTWSKVPLKRLPHNMYVTHVAVRGKSAWAIGLNNATNQPVIIHSSGGPAKRQQILGPVFNLKGISAATSKRAYAVGRYDPKTARSYLEAFNGHSWKAQSSNF